MELVVIVKDVYGTATVYPANDAAAVFAAIAGTKTLTARTVACARQLGFVVKVMSGTLPAGW